MSLSWAWSNSEGRGEDMVIWGPQCQHEACTEDRLKKTVERILIAIFTPLHTVPGGQGLQTWTELNKDHYKATTRNLGMHGPPNTS